MEGGEDSLDRLGYADLNRVVGTCAPGLLASESFSMFNPAATPDFRTENSSIESDRGNL